MTDDLDRLIKSVRVSQYRRYQRALHGRVWALSFEGPGFTRLWTGYRLSGAKESARHWRRERGYKIAIVRIP